MYIHVSSNLILLPRIVFKTANLVTAVVLGTDCEHRKINMHTHSLVCKHVHMYLLCRSCGTICLCVFVFVSLCSSNSVWSIC